MMYNKELVIKPNLSTTKELFKRRNPDIKFNVSWKRKPTWENNCYWATVIFKSKGYKDCTMRLCSDINETVIF